MAAGWRVTATGSPAGGVPHDTFDVEFVDLLVEDDEWVVNEFEALVEAGWGSDVPPCPTPVRRAGPRRPDAGPRFTPVRHGGDRFHVSRARAQQRGPPDELRSPYGHRVAGNQRR